MTTAPAAVMPNRMVLTTSRKVVGQPALPSQPATKTSVTASRGVSFIKNLRIEWNPFAAIDRIEGQGYRLRAKFTAGVVAVNDTVFGVLGVGNG